MGVSDKNKKNEEKSQETAQPDEMSEVVQLKQQLDQCTNRYKRVLADYANLEKRTREEKIDFARFAAKNVIEQLLGVVDDLEKAYAHLQDEGLGLALKKIVAILKAEGVEKIEVLGQDYDVQTMEALTMEEGKEEGKVLKELRSGYRMHGAILRPAQVTVSKKVQSSNIKDQS